MLNFIRRLLGLKLKPTKINQTVVGINEDRVRRALLGDDRKVAHKWDAMERKSR